MKEYTDKTMIELSEMPLYKLEEITMDEFARRIYKYNSINIETIMRENCWDMPSGDIYIHAEDAAINIEKNVDGYKMLICANSGLNAPFHLHLSENLIYEIYSYKRIGYPNYYRFCLNGNSHDLMIYAQKKHHDKVQNIVDDISALIQKYERSKVYDCNNEMYVSNTIKKLHELLEYNTQLLAKGYRR